MLMQRTNDVRIPYAGYENGILKVQFDDGAVYEYYHVPDYVGEHFIESHNKGSYLAEKINGK